MGGISPCFNRIYIDSFRVGMAAWSDRRFGGHFQPLSSRRNDRLENFQAFEYVPIKNGDFPMSYYFSGSNFEERWSLRMLTNVRINLYCMFMDGRRKPELHHWKLEMFIQTKMDATCKAKVSLSNKMGPKHQSQVGCLKNPLIGG